ncbi:MAG: hypothetical protein ACOC7U_05075 [Spirochaetota bacterium]
MSDIKKLSSLVFIKSREKGLLSLAHNREKSLVPVFGKPRVLDYYIAPLISSGFRNVSVIMDRDAPGTREYIVYTYRSNRVKIVDDKDLLRAVSHLSRPGRNEGILILRADGIFLPEWEQLYTYLKGLGYGNYGVVDREGNQVGYLIQDGAPLKKLKSMHLKEEHSSPADQCWELLQKVVSSEAAPVVCGAAVLKINTVYDYYNVHFSFLKKAEDFTRVSILPLMENSREKEFSQVGGSGFVKNSFISDSCFINGYVQESILFSNTKVAKGARVYHSIIMGNNNIGEGAEIKNSIICDNGELFARVSPNIGERARIGSDRPWGTNERYPDFIYGGITLVGQNVEIPRGFRVSGNCYIASNTEKAQLKERKEILSGESVE